MDGGQFDILWKGAVDAIIEAVSPEAEVPRGDSSSTSRHTSKNKAGSSTTSTSITITTTPTTGVCSTGASQDVEVNPKWN